MNESEPESSSSDSKPFLYYVILPPTTDANLSQKQVLT